MRIHRPGGTVRGDRQRHQQQKQKRSHSYSHHLHHARPTFKRSLLRTHHTRLKERIARFHGLHANTNANATVATFCIADHNHITHRSFQAYRIHHYLHDSQLKRHSQKLSSKIGGPKPRTVIDAAGAATDVPTIKSSSTLSPSSDTITAVSIDSNCSNSTHPWTPSSSSYPSTSFSSPMLTPTSPLTSPSTPSLFSLPSDPASESIDPKHQALVMLKHEAFQELASQTQRYDELFIAKMIVWESLGPEEKAQWLERANQDYGTDMEMDDGDKHSNSEYQQPSSNSNDRINNKKKAEDERMIDELVNALDCRASCKDYSALLAFEREVEMERQQQEQGMTEHERLRSRHQRY
ncbi:hypothetical protein BX616_002063 [Lobosporangium transversale]|nr:hypothetical protein BX616_002063 [Lobosporangium transversale]